MSPLSWAGVWGRQDGSTSTHRCPFPRGTDCSHLGETKEGVLRPDAVRCAARRYRENKRARRRLSRWSAWIPVVIDASQNYSQVPVCSRGPARAVCGGRDEPLVRPQSLAKSGRRRRLRAFSRSIPETRTGACRRNGLGGLLPAARGPALEVGARGGQTNPWRGPIQCAGPCGILWSERPQVFPSTLPAAVAWPSRMPGARRPAEGSFQPPGLPFYRRLLRRDRDEARPTGRGAALSRARPPRPVPVPSAPRCCATWRPLDGTFSASSCRSERGIRLPPCVCGRAREATRKGECSGGGPAPWKQLPGGSLVSEPSNLAVLPVPPFPSNAAHLTEPLNPA